MCRLLLALSILLLSLLSLLAAAQHLSTAATSTSTSTSTSTDADPQYVVATIVTDPFDILPARTMLQSARSYGHLPPNSTRILFTTFKLSQSQSAALSLRDQVEHIQLSPQLASLPLLSLFNLPARKVLYLSPYALVIDSLAPLLHCPSFCATFHAPCSFSTSIMILTPNPNTFTNLISLANNINSSSSPCKSPPDWLSPQACILNHLLGKDLLTSPLFRPDLVPSTATLPAPDGPLRRLPMGCNAQHFLFYPRFQWEVPVTPCGRRRTVLFQSPKFLRPWYWWTYPFMDLSWQWRAQRLTLPHSEALQPDNLQGFALWAFLSAICMLSFFVAVKTPDFLTWRALALGAQQQARTSIPQELLILIVLPIGVAISVFSWFVAFVVVPPTHPVMYAVPLFVAYRVVVETVLWTCLGMCFIKHQATVEDNRTLISDRRATFHTFALVLMDILSVALVLTVANQIHAETMYERILYLAIGGALYFGFIMLLVSRVCALWLTVGAKAVMR